MVAQSIVVTAIPESMCKRQCSVPLFVVRSLQERLCDVFFFPLPCATPESVPSGESQSVAGGDEDTLDDYQELSTREEQDIESMMEMCEFAISNAEAFAEQLSRELQVLDGVSPAQSIPSVSFHIARRMKI